MLPDYRGSDEVHSYVLPVPYIIYRLEWIKADRTGIRSKLLNWEQAEVNLSLSATPPVRSKNNRAREGMSDLKPMVELGPSLDIHLWRGDDRRFKFDVRTPVRAAFTVESQPRDAGVNLSPTLNFDVAGIGGRPWQLGMLAGPIFATRRQHQYYYGVPESDARPDRPAFDAHGGYAGLQFLVALSRRFEKAWFGAYARYDTLRGAVFEDSPLVRRSLLRFRGLRDRVDTASIFQDGRARRLVRPEPLERGHRTDDDITAIQGMKIEPFLLHFVDREAVSPSVISSKHLCETRGSTTTNRDVNSLILRIGRYY